MRKLLIGPVVTGIGYAAGAYYGADAEQLVHKSPATVRQAVTDSLSGVAGTMQLEGGKPVAYQVKLDLAGSDEAAPLTAHLLFEGREAATVDLRFSPADGGSSTLMAAKVHGDRSVLRDALAGTDKARLAYAPDWMLNLTIRPVLQKLGEQIESGAPLGDPMHGYETEADWENSLSPDEKHQIEEGRQYEATRPAVDPDADAQNYMQQQPQQQESSN